MRTGGLSDDNRDYLHGRPVKGCNLSEDEKRSRQRVVDGPWDPRLQEEKFVNAVVIVPNNDAKYQINKDRAMAYAQHAKTPLEWSVAQDTAGAEALHQQGSTSLIHKTGQHMRPVRYIRPVVSCASGCQLVAWGKRASNTMEICKKLQNRRLHACTIVEKP